MVEGDLHRVSGADLEAKMNEMLFHRRRSFHPAISFSQDQPV